MTPLEHCEWLKKLLIEVWPNYMNPKFSKRFAAIVEKRVKHRKSRLIERVELKEFSLGSCPPKLGLNGTHWSTSGDQVGTENGWIKLVIIEGKDLIAANIRGTSNPYVKVLHGKLKKKTKVIYKTLNPFWKQAFEFPDNSSPLVLHVKDHNALLPTLSIGNCVVEYQGLMPNQTADKWIPLQGVKRGEIHIQITRRVPELQKKSSLDPKNSSSKGNQIYSQIRQTMAKVRASISDGDVEGVSLALSEIKILEEVQDEYILQLETENMLLHNKTGERSQEMFASSQAPSNN